MSLSIRPSVARALGASLLLAAPAAADGWVQLAPWTSTGPKNLHFGYDVELAGQWAFASSLDGDAVQVYRLDGPSWAPSQLIASPAGPDADDWFGKAIELDGDRLYVSAPHGSGQADHQGFVYAFELSGDQWQLVDTLESPAPFVSERFGMTFDVDGDWLAVGTNESQNGYEVKVKVFRRSEGVWGYDHQVSGFDSGAWSAELALRVRDSGNAADLFVGCPGAESSQGESYAGVVSHYFLTSIGAFQGPVLEPDELEGGDLFGDALAFDGEQLFVGAENFGDGAYDGKVYVYDFDPAGFLPTLQLVQELEPSVLGHSAKFGDTLALDEGRLAVGARSTELGGIDGTGVIHTYVRNGFGAWVEEDLLLPADVGVVGQLGNSLDLQGEHVLAGAYTSNLGKNSDAGAVYFFSLTSSTIGGGLAPADVLATATPYFPTSGPTDGPVLAIDTAPVPGESSTLRVFDGEAFGVPFLFWGGAPTEVLFLDEVLLVDAVLVQQLPILDANGQRELDVPVPYDPVLFGTELFVQAGVLHLFSPSGDAIQASNGLHLSVGF